MHCDVVFVVSGCTTRYLSVKQGSDAYISTGTITDGQLLLLHNVKLRNGSVLMTCMVSVVSGSSLKAHLGV